MPKYAVLNLEDSIAWDERTFSTMFIERLREEGDMWVAIDNFSIEQPDIDYLLSFDGVVMTGSHVNIRDELPWVVGPLYSFIRRAAELGSPRVYGGCFGCQAISAALGGTVSGNPSGKFEVGLERIRLLRREGEPSPDPPQAADPLQEACRSFAQRWHEDMVGKKSELNMIVSHGFYAATLPPDGILLADSASCPAEIFVAGKHRNLLACQSHPEFDYGFCIISRILKRLVEGKRVDEEQEKKCCCEADDFDREDSDCFLRFVKMFLKPTTTSSE